MTDLIRQHIKAAHEHEQDYDRRREALLASYEAKGHRIIDGGQTHRFDEEHGYVDAWEIIDYRTGKIMFEGLGDWEGYGEAVEKHGSMWLHIDPLEDELVTEDDPVTEGLPESLCEALMAWVREADEEDIEQALKS